MSGVSTQAEAHSPAVDEKIIAFPAGAEAAPEEGFADNLAHLAALELEATLLLAVAHLRRGADGEAPLPGNPGRRQEFFPLLPTDATLEHAQRVHDETASRNRRLEAAATDRGVTLNFVEFCRQRDLGRFERTVVLLLFMQFTAPRFMTTLRMCRFEPERVGQLTNDRDNGMLIGTLLTIACADYREQAGCRRHFSVDGPLLEREVLVLLGGVGEATNILNAKVCLHERIVRLILGDQNLYRSGMRFIRRERSSVSLDQVILPGSLKEEVVTAVGNFLQDRAAGRLDALDAFFGYGTGLALLFHGPSGTGKTMLARALATRFERPLLSFTVEDLGRYAMSPEGILAILFREAEMQGGIVLLDECDDLFSNNSRMSQALLVELEKARCVVILASNKAIDLDPAMERRVAVKVAFPIPDAGLRLRMWRALVPAGIELAPDVDLEEFADRYQLSGGLIKNCILLAATLSSRNGDVAIRITRALLERAADLQRPAPSDEGRVCRAYTPQTAVQDLLLSNREKDEIRGVARAWQQLRAGRLGLNVLISASDVATGVQAAEALARECGLEVRQFDYGVIRSSSEVHLMLDPMSQRKVPPLAFAFSDNLGAGALTLFVDFANDLEWILAQDSVKETSFYLRELQGKLRAHSGLFCMVTKSPKRPPLPPEFHLHFALEHPAENVQIQAWEGRLGPDSLREDDLVALVERWPMHAGEIDFMARQAAILSVIRGGCGKPGLDEVREVIGRYRRTSRSRVLFGDG